MDGPLTNIDSELKISMLYVTHNQTEALSMADQIAVMHQGEMLQIGSLENVYSLTKFPLVARQIGQPPINLFFVHRLYGGWYVGDQCIV